MNNVHNNRKLIRRDISDSLVEKYDLLYDHQTCLTSKLASKMILHVSKNKVDAVDIFHAFMCYIQG